MPLESKDKHLFLKHLLNFHQGPQRAIYKLYKPAYMNLFRVLRTYTGSSETHFGAEGSVCCSVSGMSRLTVGAIPARDRARWHRPGRRP